MLAVDIRNLKKSYKICRGWLQNIFPFFGQPQMIKALRGITLKIHQNQIFGILGPNGSGKSTLINILNTTLYPDSGEAFVLEYNVLEKPKTVRAITNTCWAPAVFPYNLQVEECLHFYGMLYGLNYYKRRDRVNELIHLMELEDCRDRMTRCLSLGYRQRLGIAKALMNHPKVLFLDEPTLGLDPAMSKKVREIIKTVQKEEKITIILTTHYMQEAEELCDKIAFLNNGNIISVGTPKELKNILTNECIQIRFEGDVNAIKNKLGNLRYKIKEGKIEIFVDKAESWLNEIIGKLKNVKILDIQIKKGTLEDTFITLTGCKLDVLE
jgi:ABC-2 type transport system ATP-binding protein